MLFIELLLILSYSVLLSYLTLFSYCFMVLLVVFTLCYLCTGIYELGR